jgi:hypothetical protein
VRGHTGRDNRSSTGEGFRIAEDIVEGATGGGTQGPSTFDTALAAAQQAERARIAAGTARAAPATQ